MAKATCARTRTLARSLAHSYAARTAVWTVQQPKLHAPGRARTTCPLRLALSGCRRGPRPPCALLSPLRRPLLANIDRHMLHSYVVRCASRPHSGFRCDAWPPDHILPLAHVRLPIVHTRTHRSTRWDCGRTRARARTRGQGRHICCKTRSARRRSPTAAPLRAGSSAPMRAFALR